MQQYVCMAHMYCPVLMYTWLAGWLSVCLCATMSVCPSMCLSVCLSACYLCTMPVCVSLCGLYVCLCSVPVCDSQTSSSKKAWQAQKHQCVFFAGLVGNNFLYLLEMAKKNVLQPGASIVPCAASLYVMGINLQTLEVAGHDLSDLNKYRCASQPAHC